MSQPHLRIDSAGSPRHLPLTDQPITIGRHAGNRLALADNLASRFHCVIEPSDSGWRVRDLDSSNGTYVNDRPIQTHALRHGDVIHVASARIEFIDEQDIETLSEADLVAEVVDDDVPIPVESASPPPSAPRAVADASVIGDPEPALRALADAIPNKPFDEFDIAMVNARGETVHPAGPRQRRGEGGEAVDVLRLLLLVTFRSRATDIHLEPRGEYFQVRLRVDGNMVEITRFDKPLGIKVSALVKILSDIDISQRNTMQEGHFSTRVPARRVDYRVSFAPSVFGQKLVIRVLDAAVAPTYTRDLQLPAWMLEIIDRTTRQDAGMVLVCGPTGSGKTTTLYSLLRSMDVRHRNVVTIEDPVEMQLENVTQLPVDEGEGKSFLSLLRSILRQDPDVILVGEIRDQETARTAMQAAITGHLVFSSVHTRDTVGTIFRLLDLGVEPYLIAQGMHLVLAQRLVRQLCPACKQPMAPTAQQIERAALPAGMLRQVYRRVGCAACLGTGYFGRRAFFELLRTTDELRDLILKAPTMTQMQQELKKGPFQSLAETGYELVAQGIVEFEEIEKAVGR